MSEQIKELENLIRTYNHMHRSFIRNNFNKRGLGELSNPKILFLLRHESENMSMSQKEIADCAGIAPPTVAISIKRMEKAGLIRKAADKTDLRRNQIALTEKGRILTDECREEIGKIHKHMFEGFSASEMSVLCNFYQRMICNMEKILYAEE